MDAPALNIKHGWVWLFSILIFFYNTCFLPEGFTLVLLLSPLTIFFLYHLRVLPVAMAALVPLLCYIPFHVARGVHIGYYALSVTILVLLVLFIVLFAYIINNTNVHIALIFKDIAILNFILTAVSLLLLLSPTLKPLVWYLVPISDNIQPIPRLKLFTTEASYYSFLLAPLVIYFCAGSMLFATRKAYISLVIILIPLALSFSLGVILGLIISGIIVIACYFRRILPTLRQRFTLLGIMLGIVIIGYLLFRFFPHNPLFLRIHNIFNGRDTSSRGRTYEAFILAHKVAQTKSLWWGVGPGQLKLIGRDIIIQYYNYYHIPATIRIPNACAETIAYFGYTGLAIRLGLQFFLFFKTRVYQNPYRLWLFLFIFIYQFTGSYITNTSEYIMWVLVFSNILPEFIIHKKTPVPQP